MKVLHVGNIANNSYKNAKFLRLLGIEADALNYNYHHIMGQPEWEDAYFTESVKDHFHPRWDKINLHGFKRPDWYIEIDFPYYWPATRWLFRPDTYLNKMPENMVNFLVPKWSSYYKEYLRILNLYLKNFPSVIQKAKLGDILNYWQKSRYLKPIFERYDIIQACGLDPINVVVSGVDKPFVAFEHGTMRDFPFENSSSGRLLALAYHRANKVIITNPDVIVSAKKLKLENYTFVPHPVDEEKYKPRKVKLEKELKKKLKAESIFFAPARHDWAIKGNNKMIEAFAEYLKKTGNKTVLILGNWGGDLEKSKNLIRKLDLEKQIHWIEPVPAVVLADYYNASDIVLDQFILGAFGTTGPEAMATEKPVLIYFNYDVHRWCFGKMPPVVSAKETSEIAQEMIRLMKSKKLRQKIGKESRQWILKYHGSDYVAKRQLKIYEEILSPSKKMRHHHSKNIKLQRTMR